MKLSVRSCRTRSCNQLTACRRNHCYQSVSHQSQLFSPRGGPFKYDSLLTHNSSSSKAATHHPGLLQSYQGSRLKNSIITVLVVSSLWLYLAYPGGFSAVCSLLWLSMLLCQFREHLKSGNFSRKKKMHTDILLLICLNDQNTETFV